MVEMWRSMRGHLEYLVRSCGGACEVMWCHVRSCDGRVGKNHDLKKIKKSDFFYLSRIFLILIRS